jgi:hypothetical protein
MHMLREKRHRTPLRWSCGGGAEFRVKSQESANNTNLLYPIHAENAIAELNKFRRRKQ